ncbi:MAG: tetratricopeptide repeat protein [Betaproteobacteria bacterium]|nr:tetratricopeptide repeat protein [Betaproteobacteria bacterium]
MKELFRTDSGGPRDAAAVPRRIKPSPWFVAMRGRMAAPDALLTNEVRAALVGEPHNAEAYVLQGELMLVSRAPAAAVPVLQRAIGLAPEFAEAHEAFGRALQALGRHEEAIASFERAIAVAHDLVPAHVGMGEIYEVIGKAEEAGDCFHLALAFDSAAVGAELGIGRLMRRAGRVDDSLAQFRRLIERNPDHAAAFFELAGSLNQAGDTAGAIVAYERAIALRPDYSEARVNLGLIQLSQLGDACSAEALFRQAAQADPDLIEAQANLGLALQEQGRFDEALRHYEEQIRRWPGVIEFRWNRGIANLAAGNFECAWDDFELRKQRPDAGGVHQKFVYPDWDGAPLKDRSILVYGEQGVGDEIMFASCLPEVIAQAEVCVIECDARLASLYRRSFPRARIEARGEQRARDWRVTYPALALQSAVGSLPRYLRRSAADFPARQFYLVADAEAGANWRTRLNQLGSCSKVGISWRGGTRKTRGGLRSLELNQLSPLLDRGDAVFVLLQRDLSQSEDAVLARRPGVSIPEIPSDLDELAALLCALDLVISVDNTNVHLAGALGRPVWALLPPSPDWRYGVNRETMPWYHSVRLVRRQQEEGWDSVVGRVVRAFEGWSARSRSAAERP